MTGQMQKKIMSDGAEIGVYHAEPTGRRKGGLVLVQVYISPCLRKAGMLFVFL